MSLLDLISFKKSTTAAGKVSSMVSVRRHRPDYQVVLFMGLLMLLGLIIMYAIGPQRANVLNNAYGSNYSDTYFFTKQVFSLAVAIIAFVVMALVPYTTIAKHPGKLLIAALIACAVLAVAGWANLGIAQKSLGATRWFNLGPFGSLQPSEMLKFAMLIFTAGFLGTKAKQGKVNDLDETLKPLAILMAICVVFIILIQKDLGTGISLMGIVLAMLTVVGINKRNSAIIVALIVSFGIIFIMIAPHRVERILTFFEGDSTSDSNDSSYHIEQAKLAIGSGGLFGVGIGNSVQSTGYLPEATNDSVFAVMGETFGFIGLITILALFSALMMRLLKIMDHLLDIRLKLLVAGVFGWFGTHVILNVASMIGIVPLTGITLPLLSFGGTSILFITAALGLVFQLSHYTTHSSNLKEAHNESLSSRRGIGRSRHTGRSSFTRN